MEIKKSSLSLNFFFDLLLKFFNLLFPLFTFPYLARVLGPYHLGTYEFLQSFVSIFLLFSQFGVPLYALRYVSAIKSDKKLLKKAFLELFFLNIFTSLISFLALIIFFSIDSIIQTNFIFVLILGINMVLSALNIEWFYQALEQFSFITIRSFIVKLLTLFLIYSFVKTEIDLIIYITILMLSTMVNFFLNFYSSKKYFGKRSEVHIDIVKHLKPLFAILVLNFTVSLYVNLDKLMLGLITSDFEVGIYSTGIKLTKIIIVFLTSYTTVAFPRIVNFINSGEEDKAKVIINRTFLLISFFAPPIISIFLLLTDSIIFLIGGQDYGNSITVSRILTPLFLILPLSNFLGLQILMAYKKDKFLLVATTFGALINFLFNLILIPELKSNGAALSTLIAETFVTLFLFFSVYKLINIKLPLHNLFKYFFVSVVLYPLIFLLKSLEFNYLLNIPLISVVVVISYILILICIKDQLALEIAKKIFAVLKVIIIYSTSFFR